MKVKFAGKWYEVAMVQYNFGKPYYEIYDEPGTDPEHTDWITHPEEVIEDDGENNSFNTFSNIEEHEYEKESEGSNVPSMIDEAISQLDKELSIEDKEYLLKKWPIASTRFSWKIH